VSFYPVLDEFTSRDLADAEVGAPTQNGDSRGFARIPAFDLRTLRIR
jgi:hypothetical protein